MGAVTAAQLGEALGEGSSCRRRSGLRRRCSGIWTGTRWRRGSVKAAPIIHRGAEVGRADRNPLVVVRGSIAASPAMPVGMIIIAARLLLHPDRYEHLVRYVGWYSNRVGASAQRKLPASRRGAHLRLERGPVSEFAVRARAAWARLIRKVYEVDPLECPKCKGPMRVIALIEDAGVIRRVLEHLGLWAPQVMQRTPPLGPEA